MKILVVGGSGFASGAFVQEALASGADVSIVTRGRKPVPPGVRSIVADRDNASEFASRIREASSDWDLVVDYYAMKPEDAAQDVEVFSGLTRQFVFVSTDFVYEPSMREVPQTVERGHYVSHGYGGRKRQCEEIFLAADPSRLPWTTIRPNHIYGPGSNLGCIPCASRDPELVRRMRDGETIRLVGGGHFRQQPVFAPDLARQILSVAGNEKAIGGIFHSAGHEVFESWEFYQILADLLSVPLNLEGIDTEEFLRENPDKAAFCCDRVYDLTSAKAIGLACPTTPLREGLRLTLQAAGHIG